MSEDSEVTVVSMEGNEAEIRVDGRMHHVPFLVRGSTVHFAFDGEIYLIDVSDQGSRRRTRHRDHSTEAPMPGLVLKILVRTGDVVSKGAPLLVLEAMKMEHTLNAPAAGRVLRVNCVEGEMVQPGVELVELEDAS